MRDLILTLRDICLLRRGPQDLPYSPQLLVGVCAFSLGVQMAIAYVLGIPGNTFAAGIVGMAFNLGVLYLLLSLRRVGNRFVQTATALLLCALLFSLLTLPAALIVGTAGQPPTAQTLTPLQALLALISLPIVVWKLVVDAHVLRHALNLPFLGGLIVAILWFLLEIRLGVALGGSAGTA